MKAINIEFSGLCRKIDSTNNYREFINKIKKIFNLEDEECSRLKFEFLFKGEGNSFRFVVTNEKEFQDAAEFSLSVNSITCKMFIIPIENNQINQKINFENLDEKIDKLLKTKEKLITELEKLKIENKKNEENERKIEKNSDDNKLIEALNRLEIMEKTESKINNNINQKNEIKKSEIPQNIRIKQVENINKLDCIFLDNEIKNDHTVEVEKKNISPQDPVIFHFRIKNNGKYDWPSDTILKCEVDDSEIYFYYVSMNDEEVNNIMLTNGTFYQQFKVRVLFKNYSNIIYGKEYKLRAYLLSDKIGRIGNEYGHLCVKIAPEKKKIGK